MGPLPHVRDYFLCYEQLEPSFSFWEQWCPKGFLKSWEIPHGCLHLSAGSSDNTQVLTSPAPGAQGGMRRGQGQNQDCDLWSARGVSVGTGTNQVGHSGLWPSGAP